MSKFNESQLWRTYHKNILINGGFDIWQRGTTFVSTAVTGRYTADRWFYYRASTATGGTVTRTTATSTDIQYAMKMTRDEGNSGTEASRVVQIIETADAKKFAGKRILVSFRAKCGTTYSPANSIFSAKLILGTGSDQGSTSLMAGAWTGAITLTVDFNLTTDLLRYEGAFDVPTGTTELALMLTTGVYVDTAGADDSVTMECVQLEEGQVATNFEYRPVAEELMLCQRYFEKHIGFRCPVLTIYSADAIHFSSPSMVVSKRVAPTMTVNTGDAAVKQGGSSAAGFVFTATALGSLNSYVIVGTKTSHGYSVASDAWLDFSAGDSSIFIDSEL